VFDFYWGRLIGFSEISGKRPVNRHAPGLPTVKLVPQAIGRVLPNHFSNAFYAVSEKAGQMAGAFRPAVEVDTCVKKIN